MSATLMGAVMDRGPKKGSVRYVLLAIADNSDDYGFACPSIETIAEKACCDARTAIRLVQALEREGWMKVVRKVIFGKASVYFIDTAKLGVTVNPKMRKSPLHVELARHPAIVKALAPVLPLAEPAPESGDNLSCENLGAVKELGDNPQGSHVTKPADSGDKKPVAILKNRCEPLLNPDNNPLPPSQANGDGKSHRATELLETACGEAVAKVMRELDITNPRMEQVITRAIVGFRAKTDDPPDCNAVAELMIARRGEYLKIEHLLKYQVGIRKFFGDGIWTDERMWELDRRELQRRRRP